MNRWKDVQITIAIDEEAAERVLDDLLIHLDAILQEGVWHKDLFTRISLPYVTDRLEHAAIMRATGPTGPAYSTMEAGWDHSHDRSGW